MGLVRDNIPNDVQGITQWVYRKLRNHHPMVMREDARGKEMGPRRKSVRDTTRQLFPKRQFVTGDKQSVGYVLETGQCFLIKIEEVQPEQLKALGFGKLGE